MSTISSLFTYSPLAPLSEADEVAAIEAAQAGDSAATERLMNAYGPLLRERVSKFTRGQGDGPAVGVMSFSVEDAQGAALVGFLEAVRQHDPAKSPRLASTLGNRVSNELADLYEQAAPFRIPERSLSRFYGILKEADGDVAAAEALAPERKMLAATFRTIYAAVRTTRSIEGMTDDGDEGPRTGGEIGTARPVFSATPVTDTEDKVLVDLAFEAVTAEEAAICEDAYGFSDYEPIPDAEIANRRGLSRPAVQRTRTKALGKMREALGVTR